MSTSLWRCSVCRKAGLEEDFVFAATDELHETTFCYDCAPVEALKQDWGSEEETQGDEENP